MGKGGQVIELVIMKSKDISFYLDMARDSWQSYICGSNLRSNVKAILLRRFHSKVVVILADDKFRRRNMMSVK